MRLPAPDCREYEMKKLTPDDPEGRSLDLVAENVAKLKALFPEILTEGPTGASVNVDVLKALVGDGTVTDAEEKYGLNWHGKRRARQLALTPSTGTLRPCPEESVNWDTTQNLMIEGDNLEVLKLLQKSYAGKAKLIYIDPPYNTGKDFVYKDDFQDGIRNYQALTSQTDEGGQKLTTNTEAGGRFHTAWLGMMLPRLRLARNLLRPDGVFVCSIDSGEVGTLRALCDEVFGEENLVAILVWRKRATQANLSKWIAPVHEYLFLYARDADHVKVNRLPYPPELIARAFSNPDGDPRGVYQTRPLAQPENASNPEYMVSLPGGRNLTAKWSCSPETFRRYVAENRLYIPREGQGMPRLKVFLSEAEGMLSNTWLDDVATMEDGSRELAELFPDGAPFDFPKPTELVRYLMALAADKDSMVMDFFAGSGTSGDAVLRQNADDGGTRRYVMVQWPEAIEPDASTQQTAARLCETSGRRPSVAEITKERLRRAARRIRKDRPMFAGDLGFRVFKLDSTSLREWKPNPDDLDDTLLKAVDHVKADRTEADLLYEVLLRLGLDLCVPIETRTIAGKAVQSVGGGVLMACLADKITRGDVEALAQGIVEWRKALAPAGDTTCIFRDAAFADDVAKTNLASILEQNGIKKVRSL